MVGVDHMTFKDLTTRVDQSLTLTSAMESKHHSLCAGVKVLRVANVFVKDKAELQSTYLKSRRVWLGISDPESPYRSLDHDARADLQIWKEVLSSTSFCVSMRAPEVIPVQATADAMATPDRAGFGGAATFANGTTIWFQFSISLTEAQQLWPWVGSCMQKQIAAWELLAQFAYAIDQHLPRCRRPIQCHQGCDNSAADAVSAMAHVVAQYFMFMRRHHITANVTHIPGHLNHLADALSRFMPLSNPLDPSSQIAIDFKGLMCQSGIHITQPQAKWPQTFRVR